MTLAELPTAVGRRVTDPRPLAKDVSAEFDQMSGRTVVSALDINTRELLDLFSVAARLQSGATATDALHGTIVLTAFFEPSTRTRLSFESAAHRLGASVISIPDAEHTSVDKGESLADTGIMFDAYADIVVLRHFADSVIEDIRAHGMTTPLINGGNGRREHPTQALADWYALVKWRPQLAERCTDGDRLSLGILGAPRRMRSLRSFLLMGARHFCPSIRDITIISDDPQPLDDEVAALLDQQRIEYRCTNEFAANAPEFDVIYQNSLGLEGHKYRELEPKYRVDSSTALQPGAVVMHPLARHDELGTDLDDTPHNLYFDQAAGAVFVRQALLLAISGRRDALGNEI
ncbi:aspartate carbamoyltransferase [Mycobacterium sp. pUA109]|uniref:aspartate carbamoyltransferase n=1 Tax=Mycobacterium sp. pUA109 TaxID=3238982 RepID=UPI00351AF08C